MDTPLPVVTVPLKTAQVAKWRLVKDPINFVDITVKSGARLLAPTWDMLMAFKANEMSEEHYHVRYVELMIERIYHNPLYFRQLFIQLLEGYECLALACYCKAHGFCHRYILIQDVLPKMANIMGLKFAYHGEIT